MKNQNFKTYLFNPFIKMAGWQAFFYGLVIIIVTTIIGYYSKVAMGGISVKATNGVPLKDLFCFAGVGLVVTTLVMYLGAFLFAKNTRFQDIAASASLSRFPLLLVALSGFMLQKDYTVFFKELLKTGDLTQLFDVRLILFTIIAVITVVWYIILLYRGFKLSTNLKGGKCIG
ncbi:MAG: hypothetical protein LIO65_10255, partial [Odoribacter sp.]|nr:hypothetical protein [Odoribacter sp.]